MVSDAGETGFAAERTSRHSKYDNILPYYTCSVLSPLGFPRRQTSSRLLPSPAGACRVHEMRGRGKELVFYNGDVDGMSTDR